MKHTLPLVAVVGCGAFSIPVVAAPIIEETFNYGAELIDNIAGTVATGVGLSGSYAQNGGPATRYLPTNLDFGPLVNGGGSLRVSRGTGASAAGAALLQRRRGRA